MSLEGYTKDRFDVIPRLVAGAEAQEKRQMYGSVPVDCRCGRLTLCHWWPYFGVMLVEKDL